MQKDLKQLLVLTKDPHVLSIGIINHYFRENISKMSYAGSLSPPDDILKHSSTLYIMFPYTMSYVTKQNLLLMDSVFDWFLGSQLFRILKVLFK